MKIVVIDKASLGVDIHNVEEEWIRTKFLAQESFEIEENEWSELETEDMARLYLTHYCFYNMDEIDWYAGGDVFYYDNPKEFDGVAAFQKILRAG